MICEFERRNSHNLVAAKQLKRRFGFAARVASRWWLCAAASAPTSLGSAPGSASGPTATTGRRNRLECGVEFAQDRDSRAGQFG